MARACGVGQQRLLAAGRVAVANLRLRDAVRCIELRAIAAEQIRDHVDRARRVEHVHDRAAVFRRDLHRRVLLARRRAADQQRQS